MATIQDGPSWQRDEDSDRCAICDAKFTWYFRRHHCRKCGRVVCGDCSSQQISYFPNTIIVLGENERGVLRPGEPYRTCDQCIEETRMIRRALFNVDPDTTDEANNDRSSNNGNGEAPENSSVVKYSVSTRNRRIASSSESSFTNLSQAGRSAHNRNRADDRSDRNLCPVCSLNIADEYKKQKKAVEGAFDDDFERFKEKHIEDCIVSYDFSFNNERAHASNGGGKARSTGNKMLVYNMPPIPKPKLETILGSNENSVETVSSQDMMRNRSQSEQQTAAADSGNDMYEKSDPYESLDNECVICLEDLKPGDKVGRLECLCVFHYKCIKDWFNKKGSRECPVHYIHL